VTGILKNSGLLHSGLLPFSGFGIFKFGIVSFGKSLWRQPLALGPTDIEFLTAEIYECL